MQFIKRFLKWLLSPLEPPSETNRKAGLRTWGCLIQEGRSLKEATLPELKRLSLLVKYGIGDEVKLGLCANMELLKRTRV